MRPTWWNKTSMNHPTLTSESELSSSARLGALRSRFLWGTDCDPAASRREESDTALSSDSVLDDLRPMYGLKSSAQNHSGETGADQFGGRCTTPSRDQPKRCHSIRPSRPLAFRLSIHPGAIGATFTFSLGSFQNRENRESVFEREAM